MTQTDQQNVPKLRFPGFEDEWETAQISEWLDKVIDYRGKAPPKTETGIPLITARNVKMGYLDFEADEYIDSTLFATWMNRGRPNPGDVMFTTEAPLGNVAQYPEKGTYALGQRIITLQVGLDRCDSGFLFQNLLGPKMQRKVDARGTGSTAKGIKSRLFVKIQMSAPTLPEQQKIASFLGAVDTKIAQLAEKKHLLEDYKKGCMQQLFSQKIRFKDEDGNDFPDWEEKRLGEIFSEIADGGTPSKSNDAFFGGHIPWVVIEDIQPRIYKTKNTLTSEGLASSSAKLWPAGSVILSTGATIGRVGIADVPLATKQGICGIVPSDGVNNVWVYFLLQTLAPKFERLAQGNTIKEVRAPTIKKIVAHLPHPAEQRKIADFLSAIDRKVELVGQELCHARMFKQGLLQQMFV